MLKFGRAESWAHVPRIVFTPRELDTTTSNNVPTLRQEEPCFIFHRHNYTYHAKNKIYIFKSCSLHYNTHFNWLKKKCFRIFLNLVEYFKGKMRKTIEAINPRKTNQVR